MKRHYLLLAVAATSVLLGAAGCGSKDAAPAAETAAQHQHDPGAVEAEAGDIQETTAKLTQLPSFLAGKDPRIVQAYQAAAANLDLLKWMPCYCGCATIGHTSNQSCFVKEVKQDGTVVWDDHGTKCTTCMDIAVTSSKLKQNGKSVLEIRQIIDGMYKQGYAKPTPTPMPSANM